MIRTHPIPLAQPVLAHGHKLKVARSDANRVAAKVIPLHALARLTDEEVVGADFLLQSRMPDGPVSPALVENIAAPEPATEGLIDQRQEPIFYRHIMRPSVSLPSRVPAAQPSPIVHKTQRPEAATARMELAGATCHAASMKHDWTGHGMRIPNGTEKTSPQGTLSFSQHCGHDDD